MKKVDFLCSRFERFVHYYDTNNQNVRSQRNLQPHREALYLINKSGSVSNAVQNIDFVKALKCTLVRWGVARAKLLKDDEFGTSIQSKINLLQGLEAKHLSVLNDEQIGTAASQLWQFVENVHVTAGKSQIVGGSKILHHLLPELVPPMDRQNTLKAFDLEYMVDNAKKPELQEVAFYWSLYYFRRIVERVDTEILIQKTNETSWNTNTTKVMDNALIGMMEAFDRADFDLFC